MTSATTSCDARTVILPFLHGILLQENVRVWDVIGPLSRSDCHPTLSSIAASTTSDHMSDIVRNAKLELVCHGLSINSALDIVLQLDSAS